MGMGQGLEQGLEAGVGSFRRGARAGKCKTGIRVGFGSVNTPKCGLGVGIPCADRVSTPRRGVPRLSVAVCGPGI
ncbi:hypothetical protein PIB30_096600, partial [Stylosanthes scabra]|nr:hypothetical protein [Stylosanthes scabra]